MQLFHTCPIELSWQSLTLHCTKRLRRVKEIIFLASTERFHQHTYQKTLGMDSTTVAQTASLRSDHYYWGCVYVYMCICTHTHAHTHIYSTVILQEGFLNFPLYFFIYINQISLLITVATMHLYKAMMLGFMSLICVCLMELHVHA